MGYNCHFSSLSSTYICSLSKPVSNVLIGVMFAFSTSVSCSSVSIHGKSWNKIKTFWEQITTPIFLYILQAMPHGKPIKNYTLLITQFSHQFLSTILTPRMLNFLSYNLKDSHHCGVLLSCRNKNTVHKNSTHILMTYLHKKFTLY